MSDIAIRAEGLSKRYQLGDKERYYALRDTLTRMVRSPLSFFRREKGEYIYALKDVDLEVKHGEVLGLIGRNGAGKTTLLKLLSQITRPTSGWADIYGRVGSLLEVGTGFHPELTGRENVYLSGAILGMTKKEISRKFDEIVAFSELEKFLDTAVKHYSSGMYVRLAFAVAAHLEPEILMVDEVLAVGDIRFQKKCLGKMGDVAKTGRTVVLISHQMNQIRRLCERVVWMDYGQVRREGPTHDVLASYESDMLNNERGLAERKEPDSGARFTRWEIETSEPNNAYVLSTLGSFQVNFVAEVFQPVRRGVMGVALFNSERQVMWGRAIQGFQLDQGSHVLSVSFPTLPLKPGPYQWQVSLWDDGKMLDMWDCVPDMNIATEVHQHYLDQWSGILNMPTEFSHALDEEQAIERTPHI
jgi:lipopolysaccharide transport system ATP-binding protein